MIFRKIFNFFYTIFSIRPAMRYDSIAMLRTADDDDYRLGKIAVMKRGLFDKHLTAIDFSNGKDVTHLMIKDDDGKYRAIDVDNITSDFFLKKIRFAYINENS